MELKKIGVWSFTKITTVFGLISGIIGLIFLLIIQSPLQNIPLEDLQEAGLTPITIAPMTIIATLVSYTLSGFILGLLISLIYNLLAKYIGGIKIELSK